MHTVGFCDHTVGGWLIIVEHGSVQANRCPTHKNITGGQLKGNELCVSEGQQMAFVELQVNADSVCNATIKRLYYVVSYDITDFIVKKNGKLAISYSSSNSLDISHQSY